MFEELDVSRLYYEADHQDESLLPNNMKETNATLGKFAEILPLVTSDKVARGESAGTALVTAAFYRYTVMAPNAVTQFQRDQADKAFKGVVGKLGEDGWLTQVCFPAQIES
jgi:hypothetical protein